MTLAGPAAQKDGTAVRLIDCAKTFPDGTRALEPLSLEIPGGETVVFLGPSGCGKTTTLRIIAGLESPDAGGRVLFDEDDVTEIPIELRNVGMVFQSYALWPHMTVRKNVAFGLEERRVPAAQIRERVAAALDLVGLGELAVAALLRREVSRRDELQSTGSGRY